MTQAEFQLQLRKEDSQLVFDGDLTGAAEALYCSESLVVCGDVQSGITLLVEGDVTIRGSLYDVSLTATGNVTIDGSFSGTGKGKITSGGSVTVNVVNGQIIIAKENITILTESLNAELLAYDKVVAAAARIVGGKTEASNDIAVNSLGSTDGRQTKVYLGNRKKLLPRLNDIENERKILNDRLPKINNCIYRWNRIRIEGVKLTAEQEKMLDKLRVMRDSYPRQMDLFKRETDHLKLLLKDKTESLLSVHGSLFENVLIDINGFKEVTNAEYHAIKYYMGAFKLHRVPL
jgi:uncharacterized protein